MPKVPMMPKTPGTQAAQRGMGLTAVMALIVLVTFFVTVIFKLGPSYMTFMTVKSIMATIAEAPEPIQGGKPAILRMLENGMMINEVRNVDLKAFTVKKITEDSLDLTVAYEQRTHLFFNIDTVLSFNHSVVVKGR